MDPSIATSATAELLKQGLLGVALVILIVVCAALAKAYHGANEARIKEGQEASAKYQALLERVKDALNDCNTALALIKDRMGPRS
jgi:predicted negative regulator of RcsB-dependent stress response